MTDNSMKMKGEVKVIEVRHGLFRIMWDLFSKMDKGVTYNQEFELCGTQLGRSFHISTRKTLSDNTTTLLHTSCSDQATSESDNQQPNCKRQKVEEDPLPTELKTLPSVKLCLPGKCDPETEDYPGKWSFSSLHSLKGDEPFLDFFIDFGTNEMNEKNIINGLSGIFHKQTLCDVKFKFKNSEEIGAHAAILAAGSPVFSVMFQSDFVESKTRMVNIADFEMEVFKEMLMYMYTGKTPKVTDMNFNRSLYEVADKYCVEPLKKDCVKIFVTQLSINTAMELLVWAQFQSQPELFEKSMLFILKNSDELFSQPNWLDVMKDHPELCLQINKKMAKLVVLGFQNEFFSDDEV